MSLDILKKINENTYKAPWELAYQYDEKNFMRLKGGTVIQVINKDPLQMRHDTTYLTDFVNQIDITYGTKIESKKLRVYIQSAYPGFTVKSMEGVLIDPNEWPTIFKPTKNHWFTGFGVGPELTLGWNVFQSKPALVVGVGIHYNIYEW